jgi:hypothetical protein
LRVERGAAPAGGICTPAPGRPRPSRPPALRPAALNGWTCAGPKEGGSPPGGSLRAPSSPARKHGAGDRKAADGAPRGERAALMRAPRLESCGTVVRLSALHPLDLASSGRKHAPAKAGRRQRRPALKQQGRRSVGLALSCPPRSSILDQPQGALAPADSGLVTKTSLCGVNSSCYTVSRMIPKKPVPSLMRGGNRLSDRIMRKRN